MPHPTTDVEFDLDTTDERSDERMETIRNDAVQAARYVSETMLDGVTDAVRQWITERLQQAESATYVPLQRDSDLWCVPSSERSRAFEGDTLMHCMLRARYTSTQGAQSGDGDDEWDKAFMRFVSLADYYREVVQMKQNLRAAEMRFATPQATNNNGDAPDFVAAMPRMLCVRNSHHRTSAHLCLKTGMWKQLRKVHDSLRQVEQEQLREAIRSATNSGKTGLHMLAYTQLKTVGEYMDAIQFVCEVCECDPMHRDSSNGHTALATGVIRRNLPFVTAMLHHRPDLVNVADLDGCTPLLLLFYNAVRTGEQNKDRVIGEVLVLNDADLLAVDCHNVDIAKLVADNPRHLLDLARCVRRLSNAYQTGRIVYLANEYERKLHAANNAFEFDKDRNIGAFEPAKQPPSSNGMNTRVRMYFGYRWLVEVGSAEDRAKFYERLRERQDAWRESVLRQDGGDAADSREDGDDGAEEGRGAGTDNDCDDEDEALAKHIRKLASQTFDTVTQADDMRLYMRMVRKNNPDYSVQVHHHSMPLRDGAIVYTCTFTSLNSTQLPPLMLELDIQIDARGGKTSTGITQPSDVCMQVMADLEEDGERVGGDGGGGDANSSADLESDVTEEDIPMADCLEKAVDRVASTDGQKLGETYVAECNKQSHVRCVVGWSNRLLARNAYEQRIQQIQHVSMQGAPTSVADCEHVCVPLENMTPLVKEYYHRCMVLDESGVHEHVLVPECIRKQYDVQVSSDVSLVVSCATQDNMDARAARIVRDAIKRRLMQKALLDMAERDMEERGELSDETKHKMGDKTLDEMRAEVDMDEIIAEDMNTLVEACPELMNEGKDGKARVPRRLLYMFHPQLQVVVYLKKKPPCDDDAE